MDRPTTATMALNISTNNSALMVEIHPTSLERIQPRSATPKLNASVPIYVNAARVIATESKNSNPISSGLGTSEGI